MIKLDISNKHKRKYVAFALAVNNIEHIIASDTKLKLIKFLFGNHDIFDDFFIFGKQGELIEAYKYNNTISAETIMEGYISTPYEKIIF